MPTPETFAPLAAFKVTYTDGTSYCTSAAAGVTLAEFTAYIASAPHVSEVWDGRRFVEKKRWVKTVEKIAP